MASPRNCPDDRRRAGGSNRDHGQAAVEFVIALPLVVIIALLIVQLAIVLSERSRLEGITWNAARAASVSDSPAFTARQVVADMSAPTSNDNAVTVDVIEDDRWITVTARRTVHTDVPLVGRFFPGVTLDAELTVLREPPLG